MHDLTILNRAVDGATVTSLHSTGPKYFLTTPQTTPGTCNLAPANPTETCLATTRVGFALRDNLSICDGPVNMLDDLSVAFDSEARGPVGTYANLAADINYTLTLQERTATSPETWVDAWSSGTTYNGQRCQTTIRDPVGVSHHGQVGGTTGNPANHYLAYDHVSYAGYPDEIRFPTGCMNNNLQSSRTFRVYVQASSGTTTLDNCPTIGVSTQRFVRADFTRYIRESTDPDRAAQRAAICSANTSPPPFPWSTSGVFANYDPDAMMMWDVSTNTIGEGIGSRTYNWTGPYGQAYLPTQITVRRRRSGPNGGTVLSPVLASPMVLRATFTNGAVAEMDQVVFDAASLVTPSTSRYTDFIVHGRLHRTSGASDLQVKLIFHVEFDGLTWVTARVTDPTASVFSDLRLLQLVVRATPSSATSNDTQLTAHWTDPKLARWSGDSTYRYPVTSTLFSSLFTGVTSSTIDRPLPSLQGERT